VSLAEYRRRRDFRVTAEPSGGAEAGAGAASFVVQKHAASHLHFDFRLELDGVLKSWAVPKGPSLDPAVRRLAVQVEDHPLEYGGFEGIIPEGQYGGGTVMLWDRGRWTPEEDPRQGLRRGHLRFRLEGERLRGGWHLVRSGEGGSGGKPQWLLFKGDDREARPGEGSALTERESTSVASGRTMDQIAAAGDAEWRSDAPPARAASRRPRRPLPPDLRPEPPEAAKRASFPSRPRPQLATLSDRVPDGDGWLHEIKYDGYRLLGLVRSGRARLLTRGEQDWTGRFPTVAAALAAVGGDAVVDGELVVFTPSGTTSFQELQNALGAGRERDLVFQAFDLLHLDGRDLRRAPLLERKEALRALLGEADPAGPLRYSDHVVGRGEAFHRRACEMGLEGIISKRVRAPYREGRAREWLKVKCLLRQEFVVGGWTEPKGSRTGFGSLLLGVHDADGRLVYAGRVGTGFRTADLRALHGRLLALERDASPFVDHGARGRRPSGVHWVSPELVAEVAFTEWTGDGVLRHPTFQGLREDKPAAEVVRERPANGQAAAGSETAPPAPRTGPVTTRRTTRPRGRGATDAEVAGVRLSSPGRVLFPVQGITKLDLARYYEAVGEWMLPHVRDRPLTMVRCPDGVTGECFYQKHGDEHFGDAVGRVTITETAGRERVYTYVDSVAGLVSMVQMGVVELHTSNARRDRYERPDRFVIDLDPGPGVPWERTVGAAFEVRSLLEELGLGSWPKTTGGKGIHVVVPLERRAGWDEVRRFTRALSLELARRHPGAYVTKATLSARRGRIFLDYLRNGRGATSIAAYCIRAKPTAAISVPLRWSELTARIDPDAYTPGRVRRRIARLAGDPWEGFRTARQRITRGMLEALRGS
jgi:bifunctional non-homologous end joining protein LigD